jgi:hypothetical protein
MSHSSAPGNLPVPKETFDIVPDDEGANTFSTVRTSLYCKHNVHEDRRGFGGPDETKPKELHVVPDGGSGGVDSMDSVESEGGEGGTDTIEVFSSKHFEEVTVEDSGGDPPDIEVDEEVPPNEDGIEMYRYRFDVERPNPDLSPAEMGLAMLFKPQYWSEKMQETRTYTVKGMDREFKVITHYPDQWQVGFQFPSAREFNVQQSNRTEATAALFEKTVEDGEELDSPTVTEEIKKGSKERKEVTKETTFKEWGEKSERTPDSMASEGRDGTKEFFHELAGGGSSSRPVTAVVRCNGSQVSAKPLDVVRSILELGYRLQAIINTLKDAPKLGWYADMTVKLAQGTLAVTWGWQEWKDKRAYLQAGVGLNLKLFDIKAEVGVGLEVPAVMEAQAFAQIQGTLGLKVGPVQRSGPGMTAKVSTGVGSTLKGAIGVRVKAPNVGNVVVNGESAIKLKNTEAGFDTEPEDEGGGFYLKGTLRWTGFKARAQASVGSNVMGGNRESGDVEADGGAAGGQAGGQKQWTIVKGKDLATWHWPPSQKHVSDQLHPDEVRSILTRVFYGGYSDPSGVERVPSVFRQKAWPFDNVEVRKRGELRTEMPPEEVADYTAEAILKRADVRCDEDAVTGMAGDIRTALKKYSDRLSRRVLKTDFMAFLHHGELDDILDDYTY